MLKPLVLAASLALAPLVVSPSGPEPAPGGGRCAAEARWTADALDREIFFAVLEGLYHDGVSNEAVDAICAIDPVHGYTANFVWNCPICMPAFEAFQLYRARPPFKTRKDRSDTFGPGLAAEELARLTTGDRASRQRAIMELVGRWTGRRVEQLRLTPDELQVWDIRMQEMRKKGMAILAEYRASGLGGSYAEMKDCPFCDAANKPFGN